jgi:hypothetical protein
VIVKNKAEYKNPIVSVLKSFFNQGSSGGQASAEAPTTASFINNLFGFPSTAENASTAKEPGPKATGGSVNPNPSDELFDSFFMSKLEQVPPRYLHMNVFHFSKFNIKITIGTCSAFFVYDVPQSEQLTN